MLLLSISLVEFHNLCAPSPKSWSIIPPTHQQQRMFGKSEKTWLLINSDECALSSSGRKGLPIHCCYYFYYDPCHGLGFITFMKPLPKSQSVILAPTVQIDGKWCLGRARNTWLLIRLLINMNEYVDAYLKRFPIECCRCCHNNYNLCHGLGYVITFVNPLPKSWSTTWISNKWCEFGKRAGYPILFRLDEYIVSDCLFVCFTPVISQSYLSVFQAHDLHSSHNSRGGTVGAGALVTTYLSSLISWLIYSGTWLTP